VLFRGWGRKLHQQELLQTWMVHNLTIIGEAARSLSAEFRHSHPEVPWAEIIGMRHILVHDYFEIDLEILWQVLEKDLPPLEVQISNLLNQDESHPR
jgi:uncharacterized protein with HEPN domain